MYHSKNSERKKVELGVGILGMPSYLLFFFVTHVGEIIWPECLFLTWPGIHPTAMMTTAAAAANASEDNDDNGNNTASAADNTDLWLGWGFEENDDGDDSQCSCQCQWRRMTTSNNSCQRPQRGGGWQRLLHLQLPMPTDHPPPSLQVEDATKRYPPLRCQRSNSWGGIPTSLLRCSFLFNPMRGYPCCAVVSTWQGGPLCWIFVILHKTLYVYLCKYIHLTPNLLLLTSSASPNFDAERT